MRRIVYYSAIKVPMGRPKAETYPNKIAEFIQKTNGRVTQLILANACSVTQPTMNALIHGQTRLSVERAQVIAYLLQCEWWELSLNLEKTYKEMQKEDSQKKSMLKSTMMASNVPTQFGPDMIPIMGHANASSNAMLQNYEEPIGEAPRHPNLSGVKNAYYVEIYDESMSPRYYPKELAAVNGNRTPLSKEDCVIQMNNGDVFIKQFIKTTDKEIVCHQLNPDRAWKKLLSEVKSVHAVVGRG